MPKRYENLLQKRHQERVNDLNIASQVEAKLSKKMDDYDRGYEIDPEEIDTRTNFERTQDSNYIMSILRNKLNKLFANDPEEIQDFIDNMNTNGISIQDFNSVYPKLMESEPNLNTADDVYLRMTRLLDDSNMTLDLKRIINNLIQIVQNTYDKGQISKSKGNELVDKLEALQTPIMTKNDRDELGLFEVGNRNLYQDLADIEGESNENEIEKAIKMDKLLSPIKSRKSSKIKKNKTQLLEDLTELQQQYATQKEDYIVPSKSKNGQKTKADITEEIAILKRQIA